MDRNYLYQVDIREWIENGLDAEIMVPVFGNRVDKKYDVYLQSFYFQLMLLNQICKMIRIMQIQWSPE